MKKGIFAGILLAVTLCMVSPAKAEAASVKHLKEGKTYSLDLNQDGKNEKVKYTTKEKGDHKVAVALYINGKKVYAKTEASLSAFLYYTDFNSKDHYKDLYLQCESESDCFDSSKIFHYKSGKLKTICTKKTNSKDFSGRRELSTKQKGDGTVTITADTPFYYGMIGCYYVEMNYKIKNSTLKKVTESYYSVSPNWKNQSYTLTKKIKFTKTRGGNSTAFTASAGTKVYLSKLYCKKEGSAIYIQMRTKSGKKGWLKVPKSKFYKEEYAWG